MGKSNLGWKAVGWSGGERSCVLTFGVRLKGALLGQWETGITHTPNACPACVTSFVYLSSAHITKMPCGKTSKADPFYRWRNRGIECSATGYPPWHHSDPLHLTPAQQIEAQETAPAFLELADMGVDSGSQSARILNLIRLSGSQGHTDETMKEWMWGLPPPTPGAHRSGEMGVPGRQNWGGLGRTQGNRHKRRRGKTHSSGPSFSPHYPRGMAAGLGIWHLVLLQECWEADLQLRSLSDVNNEQEVESQTHLCHHRHGV